MPLPWSEEPFVGVDDGVAGNWNSLQSRLTHYTVKKLLLTAKRAKRVLVIRLILE